MHERPAVARAFIAIRCLLLSALAFLPLISYFGADPVLSTRAIVVGLVGLSALLPASALLVCAALTPLGVPLGQLFGSSFDLSEPMVLAFLAGWLLHGVVRPQVASNTTLRSLRRPVLLLAMVIVASCLVRLTVQQVSVDYPWPFTRLAFRFLYHDYFRSRDTFDAIATGFLWLEGLALAIAFASLIRGDRSLGHRALAMVAAGAAGVAALSVNRLLEASLRTGAPWPALKALLFTIRISPAFSDFNAAGSYLAMALPLTLGFALPGKRLRPGWGVIAALVAAALWLTGSRTAILAASFAFVLVLPKARYWRRAVVSIAIVLVLAAGVLVPALLRLFPAGPSRASASYALQIRAEMSRVAFHIFQASPIFGVGAGAFRQHSGQYTAEWLRPFMPNENAHNNYLQILAELGVVGFVPVIWIFVTLARRLLPELRQRDHSVVLGAAVGLVSFAASCLGGHPLLIAQVGFAFWMLVGALGGFAAHAESGDAADDRQAVGARRDRRLDLLAVAVVVALVVTVPLRGRSALARADLESAAIGFSSWQHDEQGTAFRRMQRPGQIHVPTDTHYLELPVRIQPSGPQAVELEIRLDGRLANRVSIPGSATWTQVGIAFNKDQSGRAYRSVELREADPNRGASDAPPRIDVGRPRLFR